MNSQRMRLGVGLVTLLSGVALGAMVLWFGEFREVLEQRRTYYFLFKRAPGIQVDAPIRRAGLRIGRVTAVEYSDEFGRVAVTAQLTGVNQLRDGDEPVLKRELLGDAYIDIETVEEGRPRKDRPLIADGRTIEGRSGADLGDAMASFQQLAPDVQRAVNSIDKFASTWSGVGTRTDKLLADNEEMIGEILESARVNLDQISDLLAGLQELFNAEARKNIQSTIANMKEISTDLAPAAEKAPALVDQFNETLSALEDLSANLAKVTKPLADRGDKLAVRVEGLLEDLSKLVDDLQDVTGRVRRSDGSFQRFINDPALYQNLSEATAQINDSLRHLEKIMLDVRVFSDKIARHPGELGVQGVLTRDKGLKTPPDDRGPDRARTGRSTRLLMPRE
jgi:phospholipid/cholesterol/gamma-HCH transport system substrate-binding protein